MNEPLDTITVRASTTEDVQADKAELFVSVKGSSLLTGNAAFKHAREVRQLVADLGRAGVPETAITLLSVTAETNTGVISTSSSATYYLRVRCTNLDTLADVIGAVTGQKNTTLSRIEWDYPDLAPLQDTLLERGLVRAQTKAQLMAQTLACTLERVHTVSETMHDHAFEGQPRFAMDSVMAQARARTVTSEELGIAVTHTKRVTVDVEIVYRIRPGDAAPKSDV